MATLLLILLIIDSVILIAAVLLQSGKGTGMAASFGGVSSSPDAFIGTRQAGNFLTKLTWWTAGIFLAIAFVLQIASTHTSAPKSVLDKPFSGAGATPAAPQQQAAPTTTAPAVPLQPAPTLPPASKPAPAPAGTGAH